MTFIRPDKNRQACVVGIHALPFAKDIGMTERRAGALAILGALEDAGLGVPDVDGMFRYVQENTSEMEMARVLGIGSLRAFGAVDYGGGAGPPAVGHAAQRSRGRGGDYGRISVDRLETALDDIESGAGEPPRCGGSGEQASPRVALRLARSAPTLCRRGTGGSVMGPCCVRT